MTWLVSVIATVMLRWQSMSAGVNMALGKGNDCAWFDRNSDDRITIDELVAAVGNALDGCSQAS